MTYEMIGTCSLYGGAVCVPLVWCGGGAADSDMHALRSCAAGCVRAGDTDEPCAIQAGARKH